MVAKTLVVATVPWRHTLTNMANYSLISSRGKDYKIDCGVIELMASIGANLAFPLYLCGRMLMSLKSLFLGAACAAICAGSANASVITSAQAAYIPFANLNAFTSGPVTVAPGITWTSTNVSNQGGSVYGYSNGYGFGSNGLDFQNLVGLNDSFDFYGVSDSMTFAFANPVSSIGAFINWYAPTQATTSIAVYDSSMTLIESLNVAAGGVNLVTPNSFYGFSSPTANISYFVLTDGYIAALSGLNGGGINGTPAVPEPAAWAMMIGGFALAGATIRRRKTVVSFA